MICLYKGGRGRGKSLTLVRDAKYYYNAGWKIISNFKITFATLVSNDFIINLDKNSDLKNCVLAIDEAQILFDSRNFAGKTNIKFSNFIQQIRKRNIVILATSQYSNTIDLRFRQHLDVVAFPLINQKTKWVTVRYFDLTKMENFETTELKPKISKYYAPPYYQLFDTMEIIT